MLEKANLQEEIDKLKFEHKQELEDLQDELTAAQSKVSAKDQYITELEKQNDEIQSKFEKMGLEAMMQIKNQMFKQDQEHDSLADLK